MTDFLPVIDQQISWTTFDGPFSFWYLRSSNITWRIQPTSTLDILPFNGNVAIEIEAYYDYHRSNLWELRTEIEFRIFNNVSKKTTEIRKMSCFFDTCKLYISPPVKFDFGKFENVKAIAPRDEDLQDLMIHLTIRIKKSSVGLLFSSIDNFSIPKNIDSEVVLRLREPKIHGVDLKFHVDKIPLISVSSVFCEIFSKESNNGNEYVFEDSYILLQQYTSDFIAFLRLLHGQKQEITVHNVEGIVHFALKYNVQFLIADCEEFLISNQQICNSQKLFLAENYAMTKLQLASLDRIKIELLQKDTLNMHQEFDLMWPKTLKAVLVKFCDEEIEEEDNEPMSKRICIRDHSNHSNYLLSF